VIHPLVPGVSSRCAPVALASLAGTGRSADAAGGAAADSRRGEYIVRHVAMCVFGREPTRPMPPFHVNREDASAVAAFVASLEPAPAAAPVQ
jgi:mono/diheme cytochrome c family protein